MTTGIRQCAAGESPFSQDVLRRLVRRAVQARPAAPSRIEGLTAREQEVPELVAVLLLRSVVLLRPAG
ncbi:hypothetical protein [Actinoplanes siamensis]|nr:hypothetical protein [Actinoplanes siamensis]